MITGRELDTYNKAEHFIESMIEKRDDKTATILFSTYFRGCIIPEFKSCYGVTLKCSANYAKMLKDLRKMKNNLVSKS